MASRACILRREEGTMFKRLAEEEELAKKRLRIRKSFGGDPEEAVGLAIKEMKSVKKGVIKSIQKSYAIRHLSKMETF